jgi:hypothetical protein
MEYTGCYSFGTMKLAKTILALLFILLIAGGVNAQNSGEDSAVLRLLAGFLENDTQLQELAIKAWQADLGRDRAGIENGFDITLSSGTMRLYSENGTTAFSVEPEAALSVPGLNSTSLSVSIPMAVKPETGEQNLTLENTRLSLSTAIVSSSGKQREVVLLKADRALLEARRALERRGLSAEKEFYETLSTLYEGAIEALSTEEEAYTKEIELALAQKQGYSPSSVYYRTIQMEAADAHRSAEEQRRSLERRTAAFARNCGIAALVKLPQSLPAANFEDLGEFGQDDEKSRFTEIESARWNSYIGGLSRNAEGNLELSAQSGVTVNNSNLDNRTSVDAGLTLGWKGLSLSAGSQVPLSGNDRNPAFTLSLSFNAGKQRIAALTGAEKSLEAELELLAVVNAEKAWEETIDSMRSEQSDLLWEKNRLTEQYDLYRELAEDTAVWYERGVITESEYRKAITNEERARYRLLAADVKIRIYLVDSALYFVED